MIFTIKNIVEGELCTGCGLCTSEAKEATMIWDDNGFLVPDVTKKFNEYAIKVCPFNPEPEKEVQDEDALADIFLTSASHKDFRIGKYINTYVGYANKYRKTSSSGGIATFVFEQLLKQRIVDHLFIVKEINGSYGYQLFSDVRHIEQISKTRYIPVTLENLFKQIDQIEGKLALSGVACFIKAVRLKQYYTPKLKVKIPFLIGIICGGLKSKFFTDYLAQSTGIQGKYSKQDYRIKDCNSTASDYSFGAFNEERKFHQMKMSIVGDMWGSGLFKSNACDFCDDVTTELADISLGDAWLQPYSQDGAGTSVIVTRTKLADNIIHEGTKKESLYVQELALDIFKASQKGSFNHRHIGLKYRINDRLRKGEITPSKRKRLQSSSPIEFKIVQKKRMLIRKLSIEKWVEFRKADIFELEIKKTRNSLSRSTIFYHLLQKIKSILGFKTI